MNTIKDGGPAFPVPEHDAGDAVLYQGMTLRDWFAGQALSGCQVTVEDNMGVGFWYKPEDLAKRAYAIADALLSEREKGGAG